MLAVINPAVVFMAATLLAVGAAMVGRRRGFRNYPVAMPPLLSSDCSQLLLTPDKIASLGWQDEYLRRNPPPVAPSTPAVMEGWIARFVARFLEDAAPQCVYLLDEPLASWPPASRGLFMGLVYSTSRYLQGLGYNVNVPPPPPGF